jgi:YVTN family beta-propeller protein
MFVNPVPIQQGFEREPEHRNAEAGAFACRATVFRTDTFKQVATIPVGNLPRGVWPPGDGSRIYVGLENACGMTAIDTLTKKVIATVPIGQAPQAIIYVPDAVPEADRDQIENNRLLSASVVEEIALDDIFDIFARRACRFQHM